VAEEGWVKEAQIYQILEKAYFGENPDERLEIQELSSLVSGQTTMIDVGASLGQYTKRFSELGGVSTIVAIEADPIRAKRLSELSAYWAAASDAEILIVHAAASDRASVGKFFVTDSNVSGSISALAERGDHWREVEVQHIEVDGVVITYDNIFVKIDIEGAELRALHGMKKILAGKNNRFLAEIHPWGDPGYGASPIDVFRLFAESGYGFRKTNNHYLFSKDDKNLSNFGFMLESYLTEAKYHLRKLTHSRVMRWLLGRH
jgi:FkbM family methyltransferase